MRMRLGAPLVCAAAGLLWAAAPANAALNGATKYANCPDACCDAQCCFGAVQQQTRTRYQLVYDTVLEKRFHTVYQTVTETQCKPVTKTCYRTEQETRFKTVHETCYRQVCETVNKTCYQTVMKQVPYTVCRP